MSFACHVCRKKFSSKGEAMGHVKRFHPSAAREARSPIVEELNSKFSETPPAADDHVKEEDDDY
jgi:hypothetical protein